MRSKVAYLSLFAVSIVLAYVIRLEDHGFIVGLAPALIVGQLWNYQNGQKLFYQGHAQSMKKFKIFNLIGVLYILIYMIAHNAIVDREIHEQYLFFAIAGTTHIPAFMILFYSVNFVAKRLKFGSNIWLVRMAIFMYPIGIWWVQPRLSNLLDTSISRNNI